MISGDMGNTVQNVVPATTQNDNPAINQGEQTNESTPTHLESTTVSNLLHNSFLLNHRIGGIFGGILGNKGTKNYFSLPDSEEKKDKDNVYSMLLDDDEDEMNNSFLLPDKKSDKKEKKLTYRVCWNHLNEDEHS
jgi:hypothetical protein